MRVIHVITRLIIGGAQENTIASVFGLGRYPGFSVSLISGPTTGPEGSLQSAFDSHPGLLTIVPELVRPIAPWRDWIAFGKLTNLFRQQQPDLVHTHSGKAGILGRLAAARAKVPIIIHSIHGPSFGAFQSIVPNVLFRAAEVRAARVTDHFVVVANAMKDQYLSAGIGTPEQYTRIFSGFELEPFLQARNDPQVRARLGLSPENFVVGNIARLFKLKGHEELFEAAPLLARRCPTIRFLLVGDGPWRERFERRVRELGLGKHFVFTGLVPPGKMPELVGIMDVLVHLSRREGLARALPQALAAGRPVVTYDCDGAGEVCFDAKTGFLLRVGDLGGFCERLTQLARDQGLRERLGRTGQAYVRERFSAARMVEELHSLYVRLGRHPSDAAVQDEAKL